jgi:hypothetical protein
MPLSFGFMKRARMRMEERKKIQQRIKIQRIEKTGMKLRLRERLIPAFIKRRRALRAETRAETKKLVREVRQTEERAEMTKLVLQRERLLPKLEKATTLMNDELSHLAHRANRTTNPSERANLIKRMDEIIPKRNANMIRMKELSKTR